MLSSWTTVDEHDEAELLALLGQLAIKFALQQARLDAAMDARDENAATLQVDEMNTTEEQIKALGAQLAKLRGIELDALVG
ncbi:MAG TPA: hypothetical protein VEG32_05525 [Clostridia bacterium]|nr:hypothetical protein [Clostridia bacterium]